MGSIPTALTIKIGGSPVGLAPVFIIKWGENAGTNEVSEAGSRALETLTS